MNVFIRFLFFFNVVSIYCSAQPGFSFSPQKIDFDWQFHLGDVIDGADPDLNTDDWCILDLPHDWSIEGEYRPDNGTDWQTGFLPAGIGWYRKKLEWEPSWSEKTVKVSFEGIYLNSDVWINGYHLGHRPNGYIGFEYDLTRHLKKGTNVLAVRVDHSRPLSGRWYTGSGIYRHVWLKIQNNHHIENNGIYFTTPAVSAEKAEYQVEVAVAGNDKKVVVLVELFDQKGCPISKVSGKPGDGGTVKLTGKLDHPALWSPDHPDLYSLRTTVIRQGRAVDSDERKVGFRKPEFRPDSGFWLNGERLKFKGVCDHHTAGPMGSAVPDDVWRYRLRLLKKMGCNAIRTSHNPFSPAFYNICDSIGLMVMNEFLDGWDQEKASDDYGVYFEDWWKTDGIDFIKRDRNHPSVMIWSIGNEVRNPTREIQKQLIDLFHEYDPTRPVTQGGLDPTRGMTGDELASQLDIKGFNGDGEEKDVFEKFHACEPGIPMIGTEVPHTYQTRGVYRTTTHWRRRDFPAKWEQERWDEQLGGLEKRIFPIPDLAEKEVFPEEKNASWYQNGKEIPLDVTRPYQPHLYYQSSYDNASVRSSARKAWQRTRDLDYMMGQFRWGSFDYLGESNDWPSRFANFGVIDICGFPKDHFYLYQSMWTTEPMVHILPHWTHPGKEGLEIPVVIYTNCDEAELFLNGTSLGAKKYEDEQLVWRVPYQSGTIYAIARKNGEIVAECCQNTAGKPSKVRLSADRTAIAANRTDVVHVCVDVTDNNDILCPLAAEEIEFGVIGGARIIGVDNGDPLDLSSYKTNSRRTFRGKCMLWIQSDGRPGKIVVTARSKRLHEAQFVVTANAREGNFLANPGK